MKSDGLLAELGDKLGIDAFRLNDNGVASLEFDGKTAVHFEPDETGDSLAMYASLLRWPDSHEEQAKLGAILLEANLFGSGTGGFIFSLDAHFHEVVLEQRFPLQSATSEELHRRLGDFLEVIDIWSERLADIQASPAKSPPEASDDVQGIKV